MAVLLSLRKLLLLRHLLRSRSGLLLSLLSGLLSLMQLLLKLLELLLGRLPLLRLLAICSLLTWRNILLSLLRHARNGRSRRHVTDVALLLLLSSLDSLLLDDGLLHLLSVAAVLRERQLVGSAIDLLR